MNEGTGWAARAAAGDVGTGQGTKVCRARGFSLGVSRSPRARS